MKNKTYLLNTLLSAVLTLALLAAVIIRAVSPIIIIPRPDIPLLVLISVAALLADHYLAPGARRCWVCIPVFSALAFGLLPWAACFVSPAEAVKLALVGGAVFTVTAFLFTSVRDRLSTGPAAKAAPAVCALCLYLAAQCFAGMVL